MLIEIDNQTKDYGIEVFLPDIVNNLKLNHVNKTIHVIYKDGSETYGYNMLNGKTTPVPSKDHNACSDLKKYFAKTKEYEVVVYNSGDIFMDIGTLAHELRHVWQFSTIEGYKKVDFELNSIYEVELDAQDYEFKYTQYLRGNLDIDDTHSQMDTAIQMLSTLTQHKIKDATHMVDAIPIMPMITMSLKEVEV